MAYRRRYLSGQSATTVVIAEGAITSDKIVDGAVTHPKVAPSAIDSERIVDETIKSEDIGAGQVKAVDLAPNAVTTDKILDGAVTTQKLEASIQGIARPLTPGVDTAEIQDGKVTLAKLAPDSVDASKIKSGAVGPTELAANAVETDRVKDGAISTAKIAGSAVDATKIAANAVTGSEILNRSVGTTEIAVDGVQTENVKDANISLAKLAPESVNASKILDGAVTDPKLYVAALAKRHFSSKRVRLADVREEFIGGVLPHDWQATILGGGVIYPDGILGLGIKTGAVENDRIRLNSEEAANILEGLPVFDAQHISSGISDRIVFFGVDDGAGNRVGLEINPGIFVDKWIARCDYADGAVTVDTGVAWASGVAVILSFEVVNATTVKFYIDGVLKATIVSTIPAATPVFPMIDILTASAATKEMSVRYFSLLATRS